MNEIEEIKEKIDIVDFISGYLTLRKTGINYKAPCPFHQEKTPSFMVNPERKIFKCFGCGESGDIFSFLMKMEGLNFRESLEMLASRAGINLQMQKKSNIEYQKERNTKTRLFEINDWAKRVFHEILLNHKIAQKARDYLHERCINKDMIETFKIGYAPTKTILGAYLIKKGYRSDEIRQAGSPDKFRDRIIFPIVDLINNIVGFTGRSLDNNIQPKYYNTPETLIFHKSKVLYGLNLAKAEIKKQKKTILVEGQTDVVLSHQVGITNVVASSGTALTPDHLKIISRYSSRIDFCFDNDQAGFNACQKAMAMAYDLDLAPYVITIPTDYKDVGEIIEKKPKLWLEISKISQPAFEWLIEKKFTNLGKHSEISQRQEITKELISIFVHIADPVEQKHYKKILAQKLGVSERIIQETIDIFTNKQKNKNPENKRTEKPEESKLGVEEILIGLLFVYPNNIKQVINNLDFQDFIENSNMATIYKSLESCYTTIGDENNHKIYNNKNIEICLKKKISSDLYQEVSFLVIRTLERTKNYSKEEIQEEIFDCMVRIKNEKKETMKLGYAQAIAQAEAEGNREKLKKLIANFQKEISKK